MKTKKRCEKNQSQLLYLVSSGGGEEERGGTQKQRKRVDKQIKHETTQQQ